jgi:penicillin-binding protein 2
LTDRSRLRLVVLGVLVVSLIGTLIGRLWYLQVLSAPQFRQLARNNQVRDVVTEAPRGEIVDDMGRPLVDNKTALVVSVNRTTLEAQADKGAAVLHRLSKVLHTPYHLLTHETQLCGKASDGHVVKAPCWAGSPYEPIPVSEVKPSAAATRRAFQIEEMQEKYPGVTAEPEAVRHYPEPDGALASSILGYLTPISPAALAKLPPNQRDIERNTQVGAIGLEASYEKYLHGKEGLKQVTVNNLGAVTGTIKNTAPVPGDDVVTNLDAKTQAALEHQLNETIRSARSSGYTADYAAGAVINVRNGGVLALASEPTYQPNHAPPTLTKKQYTKEEHEGQDLFLDKSYQSSNPPGSTFKLISSSGLLADGIATQDGETDCLSTYDGKRNFEGESGGEETLHEAIVKSCDTVFYQLAARDWARDNALVLAHKKPIEGVQKMAHAYGLGEPVGLDIPNATEGHIGDRQNTKLYWEQIKGQYCKGAKNKTFSAQHRADDKEYCQTGYIFEPGDQMNEDIGQGTVLVSPLQLAVAYAAMANGGTVYEPRIAKAILSPTGKLIKRIKPKVRDHLPISQSNLTYIRNALYGVTQESGGTAAGVFAGFPMSKVLVGGKTGTAELSGTSQDGSWFASFAGKAGQKPQFVTVIELHKGPQGAEGAAPFVKNMWDEIYGLQGAKAIFPTGAPPTKLPKVGVAAARASAARAKARAKAHRRQAARTTPTSPPPSSPTTTAGGLPPGLPPEPGRGGLR